MTGAGGGTVRDVLVRRVPDVLRTGLYAIPALVASGLVVLTSRVGVDHVLGAPAALAAAAVCFVIRMLGLRFRLN
ncbi:MAG: TRIC cation channel family protein, partial [Janthinobacterium lividum]